MAYKMKHLEFIQAVITRMARNSFLIKGWSVTIVSALFALTAGSAPHVLLLVAFLPVITFWYLDGFFLHQEKLYRKLYDAVRVREEERIDFNLDATSYASEVGSIIDVCKSPTLKIFHGGLFITVVVVSVFALVIKQLTA